MKLIVVTFFCLVLNSNAGNIFQAAHKLLFRESSSPLNSRGLIKQDKWILASLGPSTRVDLRNYLAETMKECQSSTKKIFEAFDDKTRTTSQCPDKWIRPPDKLIKDRNGCLNPFIYFRNFLRLYEKCVEKTLENTADLSKISNLYEIENQYDNNHKSVLFDIKTGIHDKFYTLKYLLPVLRYKLMAYLKKVMGKCKDTPFAKLLWKAFDLADKASPGCIEKWTPLKELSKTDDCDKVEEFVQAQLKVYDQPCTRRPSTKTQDERNENPQPIHESTQITAEEKPAVLNNPTRQDQDDEGARILGLVTILPEELNIFKSISLNVRFPLFDYLQVTFKNCLQEPKAQDIWRAFHSSKNHPGKCVVQWVNPMTHFSDVEGCLDISASFNSIVVKSYQTCKTTVSTPVRLFNRLFRSKNIVNESDKSTKSDTNRNSPPASEKKPINKRIGQLFGSVFSRNDKTPKP